ncbi:MAG: hypothetical protein H0V17_00805, partial [Deltaproteobacteria bacterium]|nr:hypothetical protein [Deltaproteobacteria bacterium]
MARGNARTPAANAYRGALGRTQTTQVHVTGPKGELIAAKVHTTVDAVEHPELVDRLHLDQLNLVPIEGSEAIRVAVPVVYHDPAAELLVLVLDPSQRHRELDERIRMFERLRSDDAAIPPYVKEFAVVFGGRELRSYLERRAQSAMEIERNRLELDKRLRELERRSGELDAANTEIASRLVESETIRAELARDRAELEKLRSEARNRVIAAVQQVEPPAEPTAIGGPPMRDALAHEPSVETKPVPKHEIDDGGAPGDQASSDDIETALEAALSKRADSEGFETPTGVSSAAEIRATAAAGEVSIDHSHDFDEEGTTGSSIVPQGSDPLTTETLELEVDPGPDVWLDRATASGASAFGMIGGGVRLALIAGEQIARGLGGMIDIRILLHRTATYPVISVVLGPPAALRVPSPTQLAILTLDIAADADRQVLQALAKKFEIGVDLMVRGKRMRRVKLIAPLGENVGFIIRAAEDHLRG